MIGTILHDRWRILAELGRGGMGEVYLAEHVELGRKEALKILMPSLAADPSFVARFRREARAVNRLRHPNIITVYDFGQLPDSRFYLSMEYAEGPSISDLLHYGGRFTIQRLLHVLGQLAYAVHHAHGRGVLHRDLKPDNLIITGDDETLKVLDFGIAKIVASDQPESNAISNTNLVWGSPRYMAPERIAGVGDDLRSDLYAIGCIAYELVVGLPPFNGQPDEVIKGHLSNQPAPLSAVRDGVPAELESAILRLLAKDPAHRFQTAADAFAALRKVPGYPGPRFAARRRFVPVERAPAYLGAGDRDTRPNRGGLRELGDALLDLGLSDMRLVSGLARLRDHEQSVAAIEATLDALEHELGAVRETMLDREASLRFALGELELAAVNPEAPPDVEDQIGELRDRLATALAEKERLRLLEDNLATAETQRVKGLASLKLAYDELERVDDDLLPAHVGHPSIAALAAQLAAVRRLRPH